MMGDPPFSPKQLAQRWGCSKQLISKMIRTGELPAMRLGQRLVRVPADAVLAYDKLRAERPSARLAGRILKAIAQHPRDGGYVYFMRCRELVKIGYSVQPSIRLAQLQETNPFEITLLGCLPASKQAERALHAEFADIKHDRLAEWFCLSAELLAVIEAITKQEVVGHG